MTEDAEAARRVVAAETMDTDGSSRSLEDPPSPRPSRRAAAVQERARDRAHAGAAVEFIDADKRLSREDVAWLTDAAARAAGVLDASGEVRVRLVGDAEMAEAHQRYSGVPGTTDVLTFDLRERAAAGSPVLDVDVLICLDEAARQATEQGVSLREEVLLYTVHAMLHCLGHDDHDEADAARMHAREDEVLAAIGVGPVYGGSALRAGQGHCDSGSPAHRSESGATKAVDGGQG